MASLFKDLSKISAYRDRRFQGTQEEFDEALLKSTTVYVGNMSFYTTEEQVYELFSRAGEIKKIIMGLDKNSRTPCGFCFVMYYSREDTEDSVKYISGTILDDRPIRVDFDWGFQEGRQWGRGRSGGQVRDEYRTDYDPDILLKVAKFIFKVFTYVYLHALISILLECLRVQGESCVILEWNLIIKIRRGGYGKLVQKELESQRELVDYGTGSLGNFGPIMPPQYGRHGGHHGNGGSYRQGRDYQRKRNRDDGRPRLDYSKRVYRREPAKDSDHEARPEKNPRFRESGDSDDEDEDDRKRSH
ncbi:unnamed protein product [Cuscuta campestris]|uniref:RRM domain-containing protein n=1 Tax=Cuscuta campestris TaxID=132261 RepID=A0A484MQ02_9ASTE|nr:unnamed protein product [Cuscuta campestris]